ncbi:hypothetical protein B0J17DRAFT_685631, partial [Rhizoctonia solani]
MPQTTTIIAMRSMPLLLSSVIPHGPQRTNQIAFQPTPFPPLNTPINLPISLNIRINPPSKTASTQETGPMVVLMTSVRSLCRMSWLYAS